MKHAKDTFLLNNGYPIPCVGFGTWQTPDGETATMAVCEAIKNGYWHIDCAAVYGNEKSVGMGIKKGLEETGISREEIFITSKVWNTERGYEKTMAAFQKTCEDLGVEYLDLYLIHWPANKKQFENWDEINLDTWRAMTDLYKQGKIKSIGVSNFMPHHLESLMKTEVKPMVNQIEYHPGTLWKDTIEYCKKNQILIEAWSPLGSGRVLADERLKSIAQKYNKTVAQICLRFVLQNGALPLPKSITPSRIAANLDVFDFELSQEDMSEINHMPEFGFSGLHPDEIDF